MIKAFLKYLPEWTPASGLFILFLITALVLMPVLVTPFLPLNDYPFHLARIVILSDLSNPVYSEFYKQGSFLLPNMAMDMIAVPLAQLVGAETASRIFVQLSLLSMLMGTLALHRAAHQRFSPWPLLAVVLLFNGIFRYGFLNYIFGLGVALFAAALWLMMKRGNFRLFIALILSLFLVMLHFEAFAVYAVIVGSVEIYYAINNWREKDFKVALGPLLLSSIPFLLTIALFALLSPTAADVKSSGWVYPDYLGAKPLGGLYSLLTGVSWLDFVCLASLTLVTIYLFFKGQLKIFYPLAFSLIVLFLTFVILPGSLMGSSFVDVRLGPAIALLWIATIDIKKLNVESNKLIAYLAISLAALTSFTLSFEWHKLSKEISEIVSVFDKTETGATIFNSTAQPFTHLIADSPERKAAWQPPLKHIASYAVLYGPKFVPMTFVDPMKQPLNVTDKYLQVKAFQHDNPWKTLSGSELHDFLVKIQKNMSSKDWPPLDNVYVFVMGFDLIEDSFNLLKHSNLVKIVAKGKDYALIKIRMDDSNLEMIR